MTATNYPKLFQPLTLRHKILKNRVVFGAHTANMADDGLPGERHLGYYIERARGGAAMIVVEPVPVHPAAVLTRGNFRHSDDAVIPGFRAITGACREFDTVMIHQLYHVGQHGDYDNSYHASWSPSGLPSFHDADGSHKMDQREIEETIDGFVAAARRARLSGFDGIELFAAYNSLLDQFWLPWNNRRDDRWGGSFENRMRLSVTIADRIRRAAGDDFIIGMAVSSDPSVALAISNEMLQEIIQYHDERALIDYVTCGTGSYFDFTKIIPTFFNEEKLGVPLAESLKQVAKHARVQAESHIRTPENAHYVIASGQADTVSIVRGQIADPYWVQKTQQGDDDRIRGCISCNQMCWGRRSRDYWISCLVNPSAGREFQWGGDSFKAAARPKKLLVVGAGPAGLEAARVAAERGHQVQVAEAQDRLGGLFRLAGMQPRRGQIIDLIDWYERELKRLGVTVYNNRYVEKEDLGEFGADEIVIATGSQPAGDGFQRGLPEQDRLPGVERRNVFSVEEIMARSARPGKRVVLLDDLGDWRGGGTAWHLAEAGHEVVLVTWAPLVGMWIQRTGGDWELRKKLARLGVTWCTESALTQWTETGAMVRSNLDGSQKFVEADTLVLCTTNLCETTLADSLADGPDQYHLIGDCVSPRLAVMAIYEGRELAMKL